MNKKQNAWGGGVCCGRLGVGFGTWGGVGVGDDLLALAGELPTLVVGGTIRLVFSSSDMLLGSLGSR